MNELNLKKYIYHGTIFGGLKDIHKKGLLPGERPVWKDHIVPRVYCDAAVFFFTDLERSFLVGEHDSPQFART